MQRRVCLYMCLFLAHLLQLVGICRTQLEEWASADGPVDLAARGKDLSFEFSTQLIVSTLQVLSHTALLQRQLLLTLRGSVAAVAQLASQGSGAAVTHLLTGNVQDTQGGVANKQGLLPWQSCPVQLCRA